ncbi:hypothetical protein KSP40_PGU014058 [Platanthera guangdongensis]|uniref:Uncharacterized protein n=1 Tax=Platanthera guangdongensis TaxID=2320717 RepID=A0ABR2LF80_9ASPA
MKKEIEEIQKLKEENKKEKEKLKLSSLADAGPSDSESDDADADQSYLPISSYEDDDPDELGNTDDPHVAANGSSFEHHINPNLNGYSWSVGSDDEDEAREREASIARAFCEDDRRRNAPLSSENTARILSAMRGISFPEYAPDWAAEDRWLNQLRRLRGEPASQI